MGVHVGSGAGVHDPRCAALVHRHLVQGSNQGSRIPLLLLRWGRRHGVLQGREGSVRLGCLPEHARTTRRAPGRALPSLESSWAEAEPWTSGLGSLLPVTAGLLLLLLTIATATTTAVVVVATTTRAAPSRT